MKFSEVRLPRILGKVNKKMAQADAEIIELISDDDSEDEKKNDKKLKTCNSNCINFQCTSGMSMKTAPTFACTFYGANTSKKKKRIICEQCLNIAIEHQQVNFKCLKT